jgi:hypothetical protein
MQFTKREIAKFGLLFTTAAMATRAQAQQVPAPKTPADVQGTPSGTVMTKDYVTMVARMAYVWGWPMVNQINRRAAFAKVPEPGRLGGVLPIAPTGYVGMLTDYIAPDQRFVTCQTKTLSMAVASWRSTRNP